jgi:excisionase family DNA binding protein
MTGRIRTTLTSANRAWLFPDEAAERVGLSLRAFRAAVRSGAIQPVDDGGTRRFAKTTLDAYLVARTPDPRTQPVAPPPAPPVTLADRRARIAGLRAELAARQAR